MTFLIAVEGLDVMVDLLILSFLSQDFDGGHILMMVELLRCFLMSVDIE